MRTILKSIVSIILALSIMLSTVIAVSAATIQEEYISDIRLIYAETYDEAKLILSDSFLEGYKVLKHNLNENSGEIGVWLAYQTTTNINDAITDVAVMQMDGGYHAANYQAMIEQNREEYLAMGKIYLQAVDYFVEAYDAGDFLADSAYRQLNLYCGVDKYPDEKLGDLFIDYALNKSDFATLFFEGNTNTLDNIRSLLAMGVSYNEDGMHYLERVDAIVSEMGEGADAFAGVTVDMSVVGDSNLKTVSELIAPNILVFRTMFEELSAYEEELNYEDDVMTELELLYAEHKAMADMMRAVDYLGGQTLYDFCIGYSIDSSDYTSLYPLAAALNEGQVAMTNLAYYYDVVRYSMTEYPEESIDEKISELEEKYGAFPINVYSGVDRRIYDETFALTSNAYRESSYGDDNTLEENLFGNSVLSGMGNLIALGSVDAGLSVWAIVRSSKGSSGVSKDVAKGLSKKAMEKLDGNVQEAFDELKDTPIGGDFTYDTYLDHVFSKIEIEAGEDLSQDVYAAWNRSKSIVDKAMAVYSAMTQYSLPGDILNLGDVKSLLTSGTFLVLEKAGFFAKPKRVMSFFDRAWGVGMNAWGAFSSLSLAYNLFHEVYDYYHPKYKEIPTVMVDVVSTGKGNSYVIYDVVCEVETREGKYPAADLNAFKGQRWNALYYTKDADAGRPLLADFDVSDNSNRPDQGYSAVHRFDEVICYDLNKYNFDPDSAMIFLSVARSDKQKSLSEEGSEVVGSIFGAGVWLIAGGVGVALGVGGTLGTQALLKKKKKRISAS